MVRERLALLDEGEGEFGGSFDFLLRLALRIRLRPFDGAKSFSHGRVLRDKPHALAESFAFSGCLAGVPVSGVNRGAVAAQANFS